MATVPASQANVKAYHNGEVATAMAQYVADMAAGGYAARACRRDEGRA